LPAGKVSQNGPPAHAASSYKRGLHGPIGSPSSRRHAGAVNSGKHTVSIAVFVALACFGAREAGPDRAVDAELGWIVADSASTMAQVCRDTLSAQPASLVFETISLEDADPGYPELPAYHAREVVNFEWNAATGELLYRTTTATKIFSDLEHFSSQDASPAGPSCGSH
jgi:hypothetical protein